MPNRGLKTLVVERRTETLRLYHKISCEEVEACKIVLQTLQNHQANAARLLTSRGIPIETEVIRAETKSASSRNGMSYTYIPEDHMSESSFIFIIASHPSHSDRFAAPGPFGTQDAAVAGPSSVSQAGSSSGTRMTQTRRQSGTVTGPMPVAGPSGSQGASG